MISRALGKHFHGVDEACQALDNVVSFPGSFGGFKQTAA